MQAPFLTLNFANSSSPEADAKGVAAHVGIILGVEDEDTGRLDGGVAWVVTWRPPKHKVLCRQQASSQQE